MKEAIRKSIKEFWGYFDDVTTSDLQGMVDVRAAQITKSKLYSPKAREVAEQILSGIYDNL